MQRETDPAKQRDAMRAYEKQRSTPRRRDRAALLVPHHLARSYVKGWKISPSHYLNQDLANVWLDK